MLFLLIPFLLFLLIPFLLFLLIPFLLFLLFFDVYPMRLKLTVEDVQIVKIGPNFTAKASNCEDWTMAYNWFDLFLKIDRSDCFLWGAAIGGDLKGVSF